MAQAPRIAPPPAALLQRHVLGPAYGAVPLVGRRPSPDVAGHASSMRTLPAAKTRLPSISPPSAIVELTRAGSQVFPDGPADGQIARSGSHVPGHLAVDVDLARPDHQIAGTVPLIVTIPAAATRSPSIVPSTTRFPAKDEEVVADHLAGADRDALPGADLLAQPSAARGHRADSEHEQRDEPDDDDPETARRHGDSSQAGGRFRTPRLTRHGPTSST